MKNWFIFADYTYKLLNTEYEALNVAPQIYAADGVTTSLGVRDELGVSPDGKYTRSLGRTRYQSINLYTNYLFTIADAHNFTVMAGYQEEDNNYSYLKNAITGLYPPPILTLEWVRAIGQPSGSRPLHLCLQHGAQQ